MFTLHPTFNKTSDVTSLKTASCIPGRQMSLLWLFQPLPVFGKIIWAGFVISAAHSPEAVGPEGI